MLLKNKHEYWRKSDAITYSVEGKFHIHMFSRKEIMAPLNYCSFLFIKNSREPIFLATLAELQTFYKN